MCAFVYQLLLNVEMLPVIEI